VSSLLKVTDDLILEKEFQKAQGYTETIIKYKANLTDEQLNDLAAKWIEEANILLEAEKPEFDKVDTYIALSTDIGSEGLKTQIIETEFKIIEKHIQIDPIDVAEKSFGELSEKTEGFEKRKASIYREIGEKYLEADDLEKATKNLDLSFSFDPEQDKKVYLTIADSYLSLSEFDRASTIAKTQKEDPQACLIIGKAHRGLKDLDNAVKWFEKALEKGSDEVKNEIFNIYMSIGDEDLKNKKFDRAADVFLKARSINKEDESAKEKLAYTYLGKGEQLYAEEKYADSTTYVDKVKELYQEGDLAEKADNLAVQISDATAPAYTGGGGYYTGGGGYYTGGSTGGGSTGGGSTGGGDLGTM